MSDETTRELAAKSGLSVTELRPRPGKKVPRYETFTQTVDVDIDVHAGDLHDAGWHHENECPSGVPIAAGPVSLADGWISVTSALESLHQQAHGPGPMMLCRAEPCSSLSLDQLRGAA